MSICVCVVRSVVDKPLKSLSLKQNRGVSVGTAVDDGCVILPRGLSSVSRFDFQNHASLCYVT